MKRQQSADYRDAASDLPSTGRPPIEHPDDLTGDLTGDVPADVVVARARIVTRRHQHAGSAFLHEGPRAASDGDGPFGAIAPECLGVGVEAEQ